MHCTSVVLTQHSFDCHVSKLTSGYHGTCVMRVTRDLSTTVCKLRSTDDVCKLSWDHHVCKLS